MTDRQKRWNIVRKENLCFNCLGCHKVLQCNSTNRCRKCKHKHHTSLCEADTNKPSETDSTRDGETSGQSRPLVHATVTQVTQPVLLNTQRRNDGACLLKTALAPVIMDNTRAEANILLEEGAQRSFVTQGLANRLGWTPVRKEMISLSAFGEETPTNRRLEVVNLKTDYGDKIPISVLNVPNIAAPLQNRFRTCVQNVPHLRRLKLAHPMTSDEEFEISLLIGADNYWDIVEDNIIRGNGPTAMQSKLGYFLSGPLHDSRSLVNAANILHVMTAHKQEEYDLERFWTMESTGISPTITGDADKDFLQNYQRSCITRECDGGYSAKFPWKDDHPPLPCSFYTCDRRTRSLAESFLLGQTPHLLKTYGEIISDQENRVFIERVTTTNPSDKAHYIPHHSVMKESSTTPIRIVYDCSCKQSNNSPSLNDCLMVGPPHS